GEDGFLVSSSFATQRSRSGSHRRQRRLLMAFGGDDGWAGVPPGAPRPVARHLAPPGGPHGSRITLAGADIRGDTGAGRREHDRDRTTATPATRAPGRAGWGGAIHERGHLPGAGAEPPCRAVHTRRL